MCLHFFRTLAHIQLKNRKINLNFRKGVTILTRKSLFWAGGSHMYLNNTHCIDPSLYCQFELYCSPVDNPNNSEIRNQVCMCRENIWCNRLLLPLKAIFQDYIPGPLYTGVTHSYLDASDYFKFHLYVFLK